MSGGELSGVDLALVALRAALETARKNGGNGRTTKAKPRTTLSVVRHSGREPLHGLGPGHLGGNQPDEPPSDSAIGPGRRDCPHER
jgi:hypothetical protein